MVKVDYKSFMWFLVRPRTWGTFFRKVVLAVKKRIRPDTTSDEWCREQSLDTEKVVLKITGEGIDWDVKELDSGNGRLLYTLAEFLGATRIIETGVYHGESSRMLLESVSKRDGMVISTDIPHPEKYSQAGMLVCEELRKYWQLIQLPDRIALPMALSQMPEIDMCYYDSDKSYGGRMYSYPRLWEALREGGIFVSDDISDNFGFRDFCLQCGVEPLVIKTSGRYVGVLVKKMT